jgi:hypothetical protein
VKSRSGSRARFVVVIVVALLALFVLPATASAATQGFCPVSDISKVLLWENAIGDTSDGNDALWRCDAVPDLSQVAHTPSGNCHSILFGGETWDDCVSSFSLWVPDDQVACFYSQPNYQNVVKFVNGSHIHPIRGTRWDMNPSDSLSSFRIKPWIAGHGEDPYWSCWH